MLGFFKKNYEDVAANETNNLITNKAYQIVDVRSEGEYKSGHIKNSILIPLPVLKSSMEQLDKNKTIITVCASGARSASAASILSSEGFKVKNMTGGMSSWRYAVK